MRGDLRSACLASALMLVPTAAQAQDADPIIVTAPGGTIDLDDALTIDGTDIDRSGTHDLLGTLARMNAGITLQDAQNNPWSPNLVYRGFTASPLQGQAQGIAVYLDGARFNQPFGDTVAFDLIPEAALARVDLLDASPVYGLNALGGAMVLTTKTGRSDPGLEISGTGGRFGYAEGSVAAGFAKGPWSGFLAAQQSHDGGWRDHSPSTLYSLYADLGVDGATAGLHVKLIGADNDLTGNGVAPVELLAADRRAVFTWPDNSRNRYGRISLHPWAALGAATRVEASLYAQHLRQRTLNGDAADIEGCEDDSGLLCLETVGGDDDDAAVLTDATGATIADVLGGEGYGVLNRSRTRTRSHGVLAQLVDKRPLNGGENHLVIGLSMDRARTRFDTATELGALQEDRSVSGLGPVIVQEDGAMAPVGLVTGSRHWGLFLSERLPLTGRLSAEIGLRWNHARIELDDQIGTALDGRHRFQRLNPGIEFDYDLGGVALRAGYAETNRAPTPAELSCADETAPCSLANFFIADPPLKQVVARNWEAGASGKARIAGGSLDWLLSAYRTNTDDDIQHIASAIRGRAYFQNVGSSRRQGVEASATYRSGGLSARLSYAFIDATFRSPLVLSSPANPETDPEEGTIAVARGDRLPGIPRHSAALSIDYAGPRWSVGGDLIARSGQVLVGDEGNDTPRLGGYAVVNLRGSVEIMRGLSLFGELRNAFDRRYATFGTFSEVDEIALEEAPGASNPRAHGPGAPRRWYAGVRARF